LKRESRRIRSARNHVFLLWIFWSGMTLVQLGSNPALDFVPWNGFGFAGVKLINAASYFLVPGELVTVFVSHA
jgi:hypothetical protein